MIKRIFSSGLPWLWVTALIVELDHVTKMLIQEHIALYETVSLFPHLNLTLTYNKGAAFSFLSSIANGQTLIFGGLAVLISLILVVWLSKISFKQSWLAIALALIIGGALGNLWDRVSIGHVVDFIDLYVNEWHWPVFNLADSAICIGAIMLFCDAFFNRTNS